MNKLPYDFSDIAEGYKNKNLSKPLIVIKYIGQFGFIVAIIGVGILQYNRSEVAGTPFLETVSSLTAFGVLTGIISLVIVALGVMGIKNTFVKVFMYMFLPAIIITIILTIIFILPRQ